MSKPSGFTDFSKGSTAYEQDQGLDANNDGQVTKAEAAGRGREML